MIAHAPTCPCADPDFVLQYAIVTDQITGKTRFFDLQGNELAETPPSACNCDFSNRLADALGFGPPDETGTRRPIGEPPIVSLVEIGKPLPIVWRKSDNPAETHAGLYEAFIAGRMVAWLQRQPPYMDRGHWLAGLDPIFYAELSIDGSDAFPRYYMNFIIGVLETEDFLRWRLWKIPAPGKDAARAGEIIGRPAGLTIGELQDVLSFPIIRGEKQ